MEWGRAVSSPLQKAEYEAPPQAAPYGDTS